MFFLERAEEETAAPCGAVKKDGMQADGDIRLSNIYFKESNVFFIYLGDSGDEAGTRSSARRSWNYIFTFHPPLPFFRFIGVKFLTLCFIPLHGMNISAPRSLWVTR